jgi:hypothetical protein
MSCYTMIESKEEDCCCCEEEEEDIEALEDG